MLFVAAAATVVEGKERTNYLNVFVPTQILFRLNEEFRQTEADVENKVTSCRFSFDRTRTSVSIGR